MYKSTRRSATNHHHIFHHHHLIIIIINQSSSSYMLAPKKICKKKQKQRLPPHTHRSVFQAQHPMIIVPPLHQTHHLMSNIMYRYVCRTTDCGLSLPPLSVVCLSPKLRFQRAPPSHLCFVPRHDESRTPSVVSTKGNEGAGSN
ncbi:unnamed protein product, partial [Ectocarpus sp. 6 AP-2014]